MLLSFNMFHWSFLLAGSRCAMNGKLWTALYPTLDPVVYHFLRSYPRFRCTTCGWFCMFSTCRCNIMPCLTARRWAAGIRKPASNDDALNPPLAALSLGDRRWRMHPLNRRDALLSWYHRALFKMYTLDVMFCPLFADLVTCENEEWPKVSMPVALGESLTLNCTFSCPAGFVRGCWRKESNSDCLGTNSKSGNCTVSLHLASLTAKDLGRKYICYTLHTDDPKLLENIKRVVWLYLQGRETLSYRNSSWIFR